MEEGDNLEPLFLINKKNTGRLTHNYLCGDHSFYRRTVKPTGYATFSCKYKDCQAKITCRYTSKEASNTEEEPTIIRYALPQEHVTKSGLVHLPSRADFLINATRNKIRSTIEENPLMFVFQVYESIVTETLNEIKATGNIQCQEEYIRSMPTALSLERTMYRWRKAVLPSDPQRQSDVELNTVFSTLPDGTNIIIESDISQDSENGIMIFSHPDLVKKLGTVNKIGCDATFSTTPHLYSQLWIIHGLVGDSTWLPLIYALMPDKSQATYTRLYDLLDRHMLYHPDGPITFKDGLEVMMDFESAERSPWRAKWSNHILKGCLFHYTQCIWRYVSRHGGVPLMN